MKFTPLTDEQIQAVEELIQSESDKAINGD